MKQDNWSVESFATKIVGSHFSQGCDIMEHKAGNNYVSYSLWGSPSHGSHTWYAAPYLPRATIQAPGAGQHIPCLPTTLLRTRLHRKAIYSFQWQVNWYSLEKWCNILHCHKLSGLCILCLWLEKWRGQKKICSDGLSRRGHFASVLLMKQCASQIIERKRVNVGNIGII